MQYWLLKSEPETYSWQQMSEDRLTIWDGVWNYQARNFMQQMLLGDLCFFYESSPSKKIMGIVKVVKTYSSDPKDVTGKFGLMSVEYHTSLKTPVSLENLKATAALNSLMLLKQSRLSVMPISQKDWAEIINISKA